MKKTGRNATGKQC